MTHTKLATSKIAHCQRLKSFRAGAAFMLAPLILMVATTMVASAQTYTDLYNLWGRRGVSPSLSALAQGRDGNLYGTAAGGGTTAEGVVFNITPNGKQTVLHRFDGADGADPVGPTLGTDGNFYGVTLSGGADGEGTIFKMTKSGSLTNLYSFTGPARPYSAPVEGTDGKFYGTTNSDFTAGTAYKITPSGQFTSLGSIPSYSAASLLQGTDGNFYGTTGGGGTSQSGTVFKITPSGRVSVLYSFDGTHGLTPEGPVIQGSDGNFYGTTTFGGAYNDGGVAFKLTPQGAITVLHNFNDPNYTNDGEFPEAGLVQATDGNFYGVTVDGGTTGLGVIFKITPAGDYSILYNFDVTHGAQPESTPMQHTNGKIYGLTFYGGAHDRGVVYSLDVGLGPFVSLLPSSGKVGRTIEVLGQGFTGTTSVFFNGSAATFRVVSDTYLTAVVPVGATTGFVSVITPGGTLKSNKEFRVTP
jgi:uncharacterized repeat protein (TIGR03803 family)